MTVYLDERAIIAFNRYQIERYSPAEPHRLVDSAALNMIVNLPEQYVFGRELYPTLSAKAAILFVQLIKKHVFENANKRTATMALLIFLQLNQRNLVCKNRELVDFTVKVATEQLNDHSFHEYVKWIDQRIKRV